MDIDAGGVAEIALIENMQRKDLTVWEEADGLLALCERFGYTHEEVARKVGKSRSTVTEALSIAGIPADVRDICRQADVSAKSMLLQIVRQPDEEGMRRLAKEITSRGLTRDDAREVRRQEMGPRVAPESKPYTFKYVSPQKDFSLEVRFRRSNVDSHDVAQALRSVAKSIDSGNNTPDETCCSQQARLTTCIFESNFSLRAVKSPPDGRQTEESDFRFADSDSSSTFSFPQPPASAVPWPNARAWAVAA